MRHLLMDPAFPDVVGAWADEAARPADNDNRGHRSDPLLDLFGRLEIAAMHLWRGADGRLREELDQQFLSTLGTAYGAEEIADIIATAAGEMEIARTRAW